MAAILRRRLEASGLSRSALARRLGASPAYVTKVLRGRTNFTLDSLVKIAAALGAEVEVRLGGAGAVEGRRRAQRKPVERGEGTDRPADENRKRVEPEGEGEVDWRVW